MSPVQSVPHMDLYTGRGSGRGSAQGSSTGESGQGHFVAAILLVSATYGGQVGSMHIAHVST